MHCELKSTQLVLPDFPLPWRTGIIMSADKMRFLLQAGFCDSLLDFCSEILSSFLVELSEIAAVRPEGGTK